MYENEYNKEKNSVCTENGDDQYRIGREIRRKYAEKETSERNDGQPIFDKRPRIPKIRRP